VLQKWYLSTGEAQMYKGNTEVQEKYMGTGELRGYYSSIGVQK
jgi:hypothetical protein